MILVAVAAGAVPAGAATLRWGNAFRIDPARNGGLSAVSCPTQSLCVATDQAGYIVTSTRPTRGSKAWSRTVKVDTARGASLTSVSCPTVKLCIAVDSLGNVMASTKPTGGAKAWSRPARIDATSQLGSRVGLSSVACASTTLCVAVDGADPANIVSSSRPTAAAGSWRLAHVTGILASVTCPSTTLCVAVGSDRLVSSTPLGGALSWRSAGALTGGGYMSGVDCPTTRICVTVGYGNTSVALAAVSGTPGGSAAGWHTVSIASTPPDPDVGLAATVACATSSLCVAVDSADFAYTTSALGQNVWTAPPPTSIAAAGQSAAATCTRAFCIVVDSNGRATPATVH